MKLQVNKKEPITFLLLLSPQQMHVATWFTVLFVRLFYIYLCFISPIMTTDPIYTNAH